MVHAHKSSLVPRCITPLKSAAVFACALLGFGAAAVADPVNSITGPLYSADDVRKFDVLGVRLEMTPQEVKAAAQSAGFEERAGRDGFWKASSVSTYDDSLTLGYTKTVLWGRERISAVSAWLHANVECEQDRLAWRDEFVAKYGPPSYWRQPTKQSGVPETMVWVTQPELRNDLHLHQVWSCAANWQCNRALDGVDCRPILRKAQAPVLKIDFVRTAIMIEVVDYTVAYREARRDPKFKRMDVRDYPCIIRSVH